MNKKYLISFVLCLCTIVVAQAQWGKKEQRGSVDLNAVQIQPFSKDKLSVDVRTRNVPGKFNYKTMSGAVISLEKGVQSEVFLNTEEGSIWVKGQLDPGTARDLDRQGQRNLFIKHALVKSGYDSDLVVQEIEHITDREVDHYRLRQTRDNIPIWSNELTLHVRGNGYELMGRMTKLPFEKGNLNLDQQAAENLAIQQLEKEGITVFDNEKKKDMAILLQDDQRELIWYPHNGQFRLAWHLSYHPNLASRWEYFLDAGNGEVLDKFESLCKAHHLPPEFFDGKSVGSGLDLNGDNQTIQTYQIGNVHTLIDVTRSDMFDARGPIPGNPIGTIITLDAVNTFPGSDAFNYKDLLSNTTTWSNPDAVSAHVNAAKAYEYFRQNFNRISINGQGGNIISLINVADENGDRMDNAFWNGQAIFYGRGNQAFSSPLARGLDVAAHELGHGVIETTANLVYQGESGALNESFADIFGVVVENEDWLIGEDIVNKNVFPVALRNMADPHNGGNSLNDNGWQPAHYSERYTGRQDNGGVHINSGIPNRAFYLFATSNGVDVGIAEQVYYSVLTNYLTRSSQFVDLRVAVIAASRALYSESVAQAAAAAFDAVGIEGDEAADYTQDVEVNPGQDFIVFTSIEDGLLHIIDPQGNSLTEGPLSQVPPHNPPSITDDGSLLIYVAEDRTMRYIEFDWVNSQVNEGTLEQNAIWANAAISKDGSKVAAVLDAQSDSIFIFSLEQGNVAVYELSNPTTANGDISTGDVLYADALEWDHTGEYVMYDAFNSLRSQSAESFDYWDINFIRVWDASANNYGDGFITKLFSGLPEQISIANPTFSKNSPYIIAFDYLDESISTDALQILGVNLETYDVGVIYENTVPGYPSFTRTDDRMIFDAEGEDPSGVIDVLGQIDLAADKINGQGDATIFYSKAVWAEWFSNGERTLVNILEGDSEEGELKLFPNPTHDVLYVEAEWLKNPEELTLEVVSLDGKLLKQFRNQKTGPVIDLNIGDLQSGVYFLKLKSKTVHRVYQFIKH